MTNSGGTPVPRLETRLGEMPMAIVLQRRDSGERFVFLGFSRSTLSCGILACDKDGHLEYLPCPVRLNRVVSELRVESADGQSPRQIIESVRQAEVQKIRDAVSEPRRDASKEDGIP